MKTLSILIPIYNYNILALVTELQNQCMQAKIDFEILSIDDGSDTLCSENFRINELPYCSYEILTKNIGRSAIRNLLISKSKYDYLLFIDGDSKIINPNYISNYLAVIQDNEIIYGGRVHPKICPSNQQKLRWKYGIISEDKSAANRSKKPFESLLFNNTIVKKSILFGTNFNDDLKQYGHEDTLLAYHFKLKQNRILHIDNPIEHNDIDTNTLYVAKTKSAIENLYHLYKTNSIDIHFIKLLWLFFQLKRFGLSGLISRFYKLLESKINSNLTRNNPKFYIFSLFKIGYLCSLNKK